MSFYEHGQVSPATSNATNRSANRGGRPKEWTDPRTRRLTRLYLYTALKVDEILDVLKEDVWSPGKEAANKHLNHLLGKDPRWMRPKDVREQRQRMAGLKNSERARSSSQTSSNNQNTQSSSPPPPPTTTPPTFPGVPFQSFMRTDTADSQSFGGSSGSSLEKSDTFMLNQHQARRAPTATFDVPPARQQHAGIWNMPNPSLARLTWARTGTSATTSTNFSIGSHKESYQLLKDRLQGTAGLVKSDVKDIYRLLKRFTLSNEVDANQPASSPRSADGSFQSPKFGGGNPERAADVVFVKHLLPSDFISDPSTFPPIAGKDKYDNTVYHFFATSRSDSDNLIGLVSQDPVYLLNARNTGGQTFMHVLHDGWFDENSRLRELVFILRNKQFDFAATDVYGRTFFHILRENLRPNSSMMRDITAHFGNNMSLLNRRDAFGVKPMLLRAATMPQNREKARPTHLTIPAETDRSQQKIRDHTALLTIINSARSAPNTEDSHGRNALHCLSEVILGMASIQAYANDTKETKPLKRKMDNQDEPVLQTCPPGQRLQYLETVLETDVDVNHYDASGNTVLMAFISHINDGQSNKDLGQLIKRLIKAGANLESRNRNGETVLHLAARLGQKYAVKVLLEHGANFHVRNCDGRSILETIDDHTKFSAEHPEELARLEATRGVLTGRFSGFEAIQRPSLEQEWGVRSPSSHKGPDSV